jgi:hypothetical protein
MTAARGRGLRPGVSATLDAEVLLVTGVAGEAPDGGGNLAEVADEEIGRFDDLARRRLAEVRAHDGSP